MVDAVQEVQLHVVWEALNKTRVILGQFLPILALGNLHKLGLHLREEVGAVPTEGRLLGEVSRQFEHGQRECVVS